MSSYLLEIGCEELPAAYVPMAANFLKKRAEEELCHLHLSYGDITSGGTPRRLYLHISDLPSKQSDREEIIMGPPARIAFNEDCSLSEVGKKFAESKGLDISSIKKVSTEKGDYFSAVKKIVGENSSELISKMISSLIKSIPFPKSMRWGDRDIKFGRPLKYILSIWDEKVLHLDIEGFEASDTAEGHRFLNPKPQKIKDYADYCKKMNEANVILDMDERINSIKSQFCAMSEKGNYTIDIDEQLLQTVANLTEWPYAIEGRFEESFLELPAQVLITSMKYHQKYFPVYKDGKLQPIFIGISNMQSEDDSIIRQGYERVLRARLNDAMFFYNNDKKVPLEKRVESLKKVVYQEKLGTSYEKMERFRALAEYMADIIAKDKKDDIYTAATLAKADLMCEMVYEFPELQGFMGRIYANIQNKPQEIAAAIEEHYMPRFAGDALPKTMTGKIIAIADKMDTIAGAFSIGMIPSGNLDPYGLRRNAIGIINIIEDADLKLSLKDLIAKSVELLKNKATEETSATKEKVLQFFIQRYKQILMNAGVQQDAFDATAVNFDYLQTQKAKAISLTKAKSSENFTSIAASFKRINNILRKADIRSIEVNPKLFETEYESALYNLYLDKNNSIKSKISSGDWDKAIEELISFAEVLNSFFDNVMVMAKDENIKANRLALLRSLYTLFNSVGDLSLII